MSNPKKSKFSRFITSKGFYVAIAVCLVGAGAATWLAVDRTITGIENSNAQIIQNEAKYELPTSEEAGLKKHDVPVEKKPAEQPAASSSSTPSASSQPADTSSSPVSAPAVPSKASEAPPVSVKLSYSYPVKGDITNPFSGGDLVKNETLNDWRTHDGVDIACEKGTEITAAAEGKVISVKHDAIWGTTIIIEHIDGRQSHYSGLSEIVPVKEGDPVMIRQVVGKVEGVPCESAEGCHIHFAMRDQNGWIDPLNAIAQE